MNTLCIDIAPSNKQSGAATPPLDLRYSQSLDLGGPLWCEKSGEGLTEVDIIILHISLYVKTAMTIDHPFLSSVTSLSVFLLSSLIP